MKLIAQGNYVIGELIKPSESIKNGIIISEQSQKIENKVRVISMGENVKDIEINDLVYFKNYCEDKEAKIFNFEDKDYIAIPKECLLAIERL